MKFISAWFKKQATPPQKTVKPTLLESKQTGSCGGMSTTELKIRIELILDPVHTAGSIMESVSQLASLSHELQTQFLAQLSDLSDLSMSHAYLFMQAYAPAIKHMNREEHTQWIEQISLALTSQQADKANNLIQHYSEFSLQLDKSITSFNLFFGSLTGIICSVFAFTLYLAS